MKYLSKWSNDRLQSVTPLRMPNNNGIKGDKGYYVVHQIF